MSQQFSLRFNAFQNLAATPCNMTATWNAPVQQDYQRVSLVSRRSPFCWSESRWCGGYCDARGRWPASAIVRHNCRASVRSGCIWLFPTAYPAAECRHRTDQL